GLQASPPAESPVQPGHGGATSGTARQPEDQEARKRGRLWQRDAACISLILYPKEPMLTAEAHPLLDLRAFVTEFPRPLGEMPSPPDLVALLKLDAVAPLKSDDTVREAVRKLLRPGGFKPTRP